MVVGYTLIGSIEVILQRVYSGQFTDTNSGFTERKNKSLTVMSSLNA